MYKFFIVIKGRSIPEDFYHYFNMSKFLITFEMGQNNDNPHFHIIMETNKTKDCIRKYLKKFYNRPSINNLKDKHKGSMYILKDDNIIFNNLYSSEEIEELRKQVELYQQRQNMDKSQYNKYLIEIYEPLSEDADWDKIQDYTLDFLIDNMSLDCKDMDKIIHRRKLNLLLSRFYPKRYKENYKVEFFKNNRIKEVQQVFFEKLFSNNSVLNEVLNMNFN